MSNFFNYMSRMKYIERWSLMRNTVKENIMEHSEQVAQIAHALGVITNKLYGGSLDMEKVLALSIYHEASEVLTGDMPTPIKYHNPEIKNAYKSIEGFAFRKLLDMIPDELKSEYKPILMHDVNSHEYKIVKAADKVSAYIKCIEEIRCGNTEFSQAETAIRKELDSNTLPAVKYFINNFINSFRKTLDELED